MISNYDFEVNSYDFNPDLFQEFQTSHFAKDLWPLVYILSDGKTKEAYVGETTDAYSRMSSHLKNNIKGKLTAVHIITSEKFNKSATLDVESNLIKYISGDGQYRLLNGNIGLANHNYYQKKEVYWGIFRSIWNKLRAEGVTKHSLEYINNSDLFKYSPYKTLTPEQQQGLLKIINSLLNDDFKNVIIEGGAGTGKTILAVFLFKLLNTDNSDFNFKEFGDDEAEFLEKITFLKNKYPNPKMALVVPMSSFRNTIKKVFKNIKGLTANMVIGPAEVIKEDYDIVLVDESHRLRRRINLGAYYGAFDRVCEKLGLDKNDCSELDWVLKKSKKCVLFYDQNQSIKPSDAKKESFDKLKADPHTNIDFLQSQFRVKGGNNYVKFVEELLGCCPGLKESHYKAKDYELVLFNSVENLVEEIKKRNKEHGLARLVAGYSWEWVSNKKKDLYDIKIGETELRWNTTNIDWVNSEGSVNEVGCIHTTQGYDLNYTGVIFGHEITYNKEKDEIVILKENYFDKNGKQSIEDPEELKAFILNIYKTVMLRGIRGTYIYICDPGLREYFKKFIPQFEAEEEELELLPHDEVIPFVNSVPLYDLKAAAGNFSEEQNVKDFDWVELPPRFKPSKDFFACYVKGESMNKIIPNGSICLFRKDPGGTRNGKIVLVEHSSIQDPDFGSGYTVKEYHSKKNMENGVWSHSSITLKPLSYNEEFLDIEIEEDDLSSFRVMGIFEEVLY